MVLCTHLIKSEGAEMACVSVWTHLKTAGQGSQDVAAQQAATLSSVSGTHMMGEEKQVLTQYSQHKCTVVHEQTFKNQQTGQKQQNSSSGCHGGW